MNIYIKLMVIGVFSVSSVFVQAQTSEQVRNSNSLITQDRAKIMILTV